ncbi:SUMO protein smt3 [Coemansia sp. RSA 2711]|nr:SUMO protein smt3 [Coemansia sp. RSA 2711]KAJ1849977.1 SUMO protein smt3 [Coemansia sp. RSA 2708]KAJ2360548.1 SUMO protein smt3 [Coemansia sp. RSA 2610]
MENNATSNVDVKDAKPETETGHINIRVASSDSSEIMFKIKRSTKLAKLMQAYCSRTGKSSGTVRFLVDGERITGESTPETLGLEDGDTIDAMTEQVGGGTRC